MTMSVRKIKAGNVNTTIDRFIGEAGVLFYDSNTGALRLSDGHTPGGLPLTTATNFASSSTVGQVRVDGVTIVANQYGVISAVGGTILGDRLTSGTAVLRLASTGIVTTPGHLLPNSNLTYDLGSLNSQWRSLYVGTSTIYIGGVPLTMDTATNTLIVNGNPMTSGGSGSRTARYAAQRCD